ncbi:unnamed protein product [Oikopleura dioica]|uniref:GST C-terminal domain-containing protein n=1 Tax=Oikopleura dioica TaxID=34765 RepID=E4WWH6_OIKDI|nr:unnamed protein product [Oikopleura dioica]CBY30475.1 unnamed protein product [Oikopleura dioica]CBY30477.1 unnamed protein product [Oikopleura dioica]
MSCKLRSGIQPVQNFAVLKKVIALGADKLDWGRKTITEGFKAVENAIKPEWKFSAGDAITVADLCLVPQVYNAKRFGVEMSSFPRISEVAARLEALEEFKAAHPSVQPDAAN